MYRCVSVTYKHKTFCKIYTGTPSPTAGSAEVAGTAQDKHCSAPGQSGTVPGWEAPASTGSCGAAGPRWRLAGSGASKPQRLVRTCSRF